MEEIKRIKKVLSMMVSMHSTLRDKYYRLSLTLNITLFIASVILNSLVFATEEYIKKISFLEGNIELMIGLTSIVVFLSSILMLVVRWDKKSANHEEAKKQLSQLLNESRELIQNEEDLTELKTSSFIQKYSQINSMLVAIPESKFNKLKHKHLHKVALSKYISDNHSSPFLITRVKFLVESLKD